MWKAIALVSSFTAGFFSFPIVIYLLRDVLPPTLFTPSDWEDK